MLDEDVDAAVPGLGGDPVDADARRGGAGGMPGTERVAADPAARESGRLGAFLDEGGDGVAGDGLQRPGAGAEAGEDRAGSGAAEGEPGVQGSDGIVRA